jgi:hypothetical protein
MDNQAKASRDSLFCLSLATPGVASAASSGVSTVDIAITCRTSEKALVAIFGAQTQQTFEACMTSENEARSQIVKNWLNFPAGARQRCVNTTDTYQATSSGSRALRWNSRSMSRAKEQRPILQPLKVEVLAPSCALVRPPIVGVLESVLRPNRALSCNLDQMAQSPV